MVTFMNNMTGGNLCISETQNTGADILCYLASMKAGDVPLITVCKTKNHLLLCSVILGQWGHLHPPCLRGIMLFGFSLQK